MGEVLQANIFFFITSIAVIVFTLLLCIVLYHLIKILKSIRRVVEKIEIGSEIIAEDMAHLRSYFTESSMLSYLIGIFFGRQDHHRPPRKHATKKAAKKRSGTRLSIKDED